MPLFATGNPYNSTTGQTTIVAGDDYKAADGRAAVFTNPNGSWPNLTNAAVYFVGQSGNFPPQQYSTVPVAEMFPMALIAPILGTVVQATGNGQQVSFDLPSANTSVTPSPSPTDLYSFAIYALIPSGDMITLQTGPLQVLGVSA